MDNSLIVDGLNVAELNDDELRNRLQNLGFNAGPILATTRIVYQRKLARLLKNEDSFADLDSENEPVSGGTYPESPVLNSSYDSYSGSPSFSADDLRRRPLSRVEGGRYLNDPPILSPHKPWSPDDIVTQVQPPPEEDKPFMSTTTMFAVIVVFLLFALLVYYNMESTPQTPFS
jgi:hypothetical protein